MIMMQQIPKQILDLYSICIKKNGDFNFRKFSAEMKSHPAISDWFNAASNQFGFEVTPLIVYLTSIENGLSQVRYA